MYKSGRKNNEKQRGIRSQQSCPKKIENIKEKNMVIDDLVQYKKKSYHILQ